MLGLKPVKILKIAKYYNTIVAAKMLFSVDFIMNYNDNNNNKNSNKNYSNIVFFCPTGSACAWTARKNIKWYILRKPTLSG